MAALSKSDFALLLKRGQIIREQTERISDLEMKLRRAERELAEAPEAQAPEAQDSAPLDSTALLPGEDIQAWRRRQLGF